LGLLKIKTEEGGGLMVLKLSFDVKVRIKMKDACRYCKERKIKCIN